MRNKLKEKINLYYAGGSERRILCLQEIPGVGKVNSVGGGKEPDIREVGIITGLKLGYARQRLKNLNESSSNRNLLIAADARTEIQAERNGSDVFVSKGKPKNKRDVLSNFVAMQAIAEKHGYASYRVVSASAIENIVRLGSETIQAEVVLSRKSLDYLVSTGGFVSYLKAFEIFYSTHPYSNKGLTAINVTKLSGGISLPVLVSMGLVESIDGIKLRNNDDDIVYDALKGGLLTVACGFGPNILNKIHPDALEMILAWDWLNQVTTKTIQSFKENSVNLH